MSLPEMLPRKTMRLDITMVTTLNEVTVPVLEWRQSMADELDKATLTIEVDGEPALHIPEFATFEIRPGFLEIEKRLKLLEDVLRSADVTGSALVRRVPGGYEVIPTDSYTLMSNDPDDKD